MNDSTLGVVRPIDDKGPRRYPPSYMEITAKGQAHRKCNVAPPINQGSDKTATKRFLRPFRRGENRHVGPSGPVGSSSWTVVSLKYDLAEVLY
ncbi:hypothetical protein RUM44_009450 [Polyplax serrata]|uniref:Uncharacterized protein n=1 Tax=Polyplax serrata TaxID=468196 RepID=A0ABR1ASZ2_POLSC